MKAVNVATSNFKLIKIKVEIEMISLESTEWRNILQRAQIIRTIRVAKVGLYVLAERPGPGQTHKYTDTNTQTQGRTK